MPNSMYLRSIRLTNTGPIADVQIELPFLDDRPLPLVIVGPNGSGKSTIFSFIVNALVMFKQHVFEDVEVEKGRVYRLRSGLAIRGGANYYRSSVKFDNNATLEEWQLDRARKSFEADLGWTPPHSTWNQIPEHEFSHFAPNLGTLTAPHEMEAVLNANCTLFFGADRFEPPDWLNADNLSTELRLPDPARTKGRTPRRIFARNRLKPTMEWLASVMFDVLLHEHAESPVTIQAPGQPVKVVIGRLPRPGAATSAFDAVTSILREILVEKPADELRLQVGGRQSRIVNASIIRAGVVIKTIPDVLSLSAGESALFCIFASIIKDADQAGIAFSKLDQLLGVVLIDEADLHLHLGLQYRVLPKLIALFPRIQFVLSVHSPLVALGMSATLGPGGFVIREMPSGQPISPESYTDFLNAFELLSQTKKFRDTLLNQAVAMAKPVLLVEGKTDAELISIAWAKLHPGVDLPFTPVGCGADTGAGGAKTVNSALRYLTGVFDKKVIAVFDNDREGAPQFVGLRPPDFVPGIDRDHKRHATKDVHAILLPIPAGRESFVPAAYPPRVLEIEHYFTDAVLQASGMQGAPIYPGTTVFEITGDKTNFAANAVTLDPIEFTAFANFFARITALS